MHIHFLHIKKPSQSLINRLAITVMTSPLKGMFTENLLHEDPTGVLHDYLLAGQVQRVQTQYASAKGTDAYSNMASYVHVSSSDIQKIFCH